MGFVASRPGSSNTAPVRDGKRLAKPVDAATLLRTALARDAAPSS